MGEVLDTKFENDTFTIQTDKKYLADLINTELNILSIKRAMRYLGFDFEIKVELIECNNEKAEKDIEFLKNKFGSHLKID